MDYKTDKSESSESSPNTVRSGRLKIFQHLRDTINSNSGTPKLVLLSKLFRHPWRPYFDTHDDYAPLLNPSTSSDVVEGRVSFNLKEHLFLLKKYFKGKCPPCFLKFVVDYQICSQYCYAEICSREHLPRVTYFFESSKSTCSYPFFHRKPEERENATTAEDFFKEF